jgi:hypothetical protein
MKTYRPADMRFYVDADILGLAKLLVQVRNDVTYPGGVLHKRTRPACSITDPRTLDPVWIPQVAAKGLLIVTRDRNVRTTELRSQLYGSMALGWSRCTVRRSRAPGSSLNCS